MQASAVWPVIEHVVNKSLIGIVVAGVGALLMYPLKYPFKKAKAEWQSLKSDIDSAKKELVNQRTNCLSTLQDQGEKQIELLGKCATTLEAMHLSQAEMSGYLKASLDKH